MGAVFEPQKAGAVLSELVKSAPALVTEKLGELALHIQKFQDLQSERKTASKIEALCDITKRESTFLSGLPDQTKTFIAELGLPASRVFSDQPLVTPEQLRELARVINQFKELSALPPAQVSDLEAHFSRLTSCVRTVNNFFLALHDPEAAACEQARLVYQDIRVEESRFIGFRVESSLPVHLGSSGATLVPFDSSRFLHWETDGTVIYQLGPKREWVTTKLEGEFWSVKPIPGTSSFMTCERDYVKLWQQGTNGSWHSENLGHCRLNPFIHAKDRFAILYLCEKPNSSDSPILTLIRTDGDGSMKRSPLTSGEKFGDPSTLRSGPDGLMLTESNGKIQSLSISGDAIERSDIIIDPEANEQKHQIYSILTDGSLIVSTDDKPKSEHRFSPKAQPPTYRLLPYERDRKSWDASKAEIIPLPSWGGEIVELADGRFLVYGNSSLQIVQRGAVGCEATIQPIALKNIYSRPVALADGRFIVSTYISSEDKVAVYEPFNGGWFGQTLKDLSDTPIVLPGSGFLIGYSKDKIRVLSPDMRQAREPRKG